MFNLDTRLANGTTTFEGRVEVFYNGAWGTVCDDYWDIHNARVVCRSLGYGDALRATSGATYGPGSGDIILDNVHCSGSEPKIMWCNHNGFEMHNCGKLEDAGVICTGMIEIRCLYITLTKQTTV